MSVKSKMELPHHLRTNDSDRYCLVSNDILGVSTVVDGFVGNLGDLSEKGLSYVILFGEKERQQYLGTGKTLKEIALLEYGKPKDILLFLKGKNSGGMQIQGTIRNHMFMLGLSINEVQIELERFFNAFKENDRTRLEKLNFRNYLNQFFRTASERSTSNININIALNTTFVNLISAAGGFNSDIQRIYQRYGNKAKPIYLKYGVQLHGDYGTKIISFVNTGSAILQEEILSEEDKAPYIAELNKRIRIEEFIQTCWRRCLGAVQLDSDLDLMLEYLLDDITLKKLRRESYTDFDLGHIGDREFEKQTLQYTFKVERFADSKKNNHDTTIHDCFVKSIAHYLEEQNSTMGINLDAIQNQVWTSINQTYLKYLQKLGWNNS
ncbi:MAG: hypothetical protein ACI86H_001062 [bacterium]|jgi:hypothetical protein